MAKPRIFVSSTYYDLKHIRNSLRDFIESFGYEAVLFEEGDIPFHHDAPLDASCYDEIKKCHILVLIIGGRYGAATSDTPEDTNKQIEFYNSITRREYETARKQDLPIYVFVDKNVMAEYHTYKKNRKNSSIEYAHVDNVAIFKLVDDIYTQKRNNLIKEFEKLDEIVDWLREQWAGLFADFLLMKKGTHDLADLATQIGGLKDVSFVLKEYTELIMEKLQPDHFDDRIKSSNQKLIDKMLKRLEHEPLIQHVVEMSGHGVGIKKVLTSFQNSKTLEEFLRSAKLPNDEIGRLLNFEQAFQDYLRLKEDVDL